MHTPVSSLSTTPIGFSPYNLFSESDPSLVFALPGSTEYESFSQHIKNVFQKTYGAKIEVNYPLLMGFMDEEENPLVALGIRRAINSVPLFLEQYLDYPAESCLQTVTGQPVLRHTIVEVGNLASTGKGDILNLLKCLSFYLDQEGVSHLLLTGTSLLKRYINSLGLYPHILAEALPSRLAQDAAQWGTYYETKPKVLAGSVSAFRAGLESHSRTKRECK